MAIIPVAHAQETVPSPQQVYQTLIGLREQERYKEGTRWDNDTHNNYHWQGGPVAGNITVGDGCAAFAFELSDKAFGSLPARTYTTGQFTLSNVRAGDILRVENNTHSVIVLQVTEAGAILAEANYHINGGSGQVHWGRAVSKEYVEDANYFITRYPENYVDPDDPTANVVFDNGTTGPLAWALTNAGTLTISGTGPMPDYEQPSAAPWYAHKDKIFTVRIENGVTSVGQNAFYDPSNGYALLSVTIPDGVTAIGANAFYKSNLVSVSIPGSVKTVGNDAFHACGNLTSVSIAEGVEAIGERAFQSCTSLPSITLPASVRSVGAGAFWQCGELRAATFQPGSTDVAVSMGNNMFSQCYRLSQVTLPLKIDCISDGMFQNCLLLTSLSIPQGAKSIGGQAFASCSFLSAVHIPASVTSIGTAAFSSTGLTDIHFGGTEDQWSRVEKIGDTQAALANVTVHYNAQPTEHTHAWAAEWNSSSTHHWHNCTASGCTITADSGKDGYGTHTYGGWTVSQEATSSAAGSRYRDCNLCGYRETQTIPATGGTSGGSSSNGGSSGGGSSNTTTVRNPDGSTTTTTTNNRTGVVTTTTTDKEGNQTKTVTQKDGSSVASVTRTDGTTATITTSAAGMTEAEVKLPAAVVDAAWEKGEPVSLSIPAVTAARDTASAPAVTVNTNSSAPVKVEISITAPTPGTVAVLVKTDGTMEVIKTSIPTEDSIVTELPGGATVKVVDNSKNFSDIPASHWASDAISFVSAREVFSGTGADKFSPDLPMTRAMLMTVLARFDGADVDGGATWYEKGTEWAVANGVSDGSDPNRNISREQLVVMLWRYAGSPASAASLDRFTDVGEANSYAQEALRWAVENGIIHGVGNGYLNPRGQATRAQAAQILKNFIVPFTSR